MQWAAGGLVHWATHMALVYLFLPKRAGTQAPLKVHDRAPSSPPLSAGCMSLSVQAGGVSDEEMFRTFNMGVGMVIVVAPQDAEAVLAAGVGAFRLGDIAEGDGVQMLDSL